MIRKRTFLTTLGLIGVAAVLGVAGVGAFVVVDLRTMLESHVGAALDRRLSIGSLRIGWGNPLSIEAKDVRLANTPWGSEPDILRLEGVSADVDLWPLLRGIVRYGNLHLEKPTIVLERNAAGVGNWRFEGGGSPRPLLSNRRANFPTLIDFSLNDGAISYRTSSGAWLRVALRDLAIRSMGDDRPVSLSANGAYNGIPVRLTAQTDSFSMMRNTARPFGVRFSLVAAPGSIGFDGTMMDPLDFDGLRGSVHIDARNLGEFLKIFGAEIRADFPLLVDSPLSRQGDHWLLPAAKGRLAEDGFAGTLALDEGAHGQADRIVVVQDFARLDLRRLADATKNGSMPAMPLRLDRDPGATLDMRIASERAEYGTALISDLVVHARLLPAQLSVDELSLSVAGGTVKASGTVKSATNGSHIAARLDLGGVDFGQIAGWIGAEVDQLSGKLDGRFTLDMTGASLADAFGKSDGQAVLSMAQGRVARAMLENASVNLRALFRKSQAWVELSCLLGVFDLHDGVARISPLRLRTPDTTLIAAGQINFLTDSIDMTLQSESSSADILALNLPLHIDGSFSKLNVNPLLGAKATIAGKEAAEHLTPELRQLAERNACLR